MLKKQKDKQGLCLLLLFFCTKLRNSAEDVKQANCAKIESWRKLGRTFVVSKMVRKKTLAIVIKFSWLREEP